MGWNRTNGTRYPTNGNYCHENAMKCPEINGRERSDDARQYAGYGHIEPGSKRCRTRAASDNGMVCDRP